MTTLTDLVEMAAADNGVAPADVLGAGRRTDEVTARFQVCRVLRRSGWSYPDIGRAVGRDHSTAMHAVAQATERLWMVDVRVSPPVRAVSSSLPAACVISGCGRARHARGMCLAHNYRDKHMGDVAAHVPIGGFHDPDPEPPTECVDCQGEPMPGGVIRCEPCLLEDLDRRAKARARPVRVRIDPARVAVKGRT